MADLNQVDKTAQEDYQTANNNIKLPSNDAQPDQNSPVISNNTPKYIRHKWKYIKFKRLVQKGGFTTASLVARSLGIDRSTVESWLNTKPIQEALQADIREYVSKIKKSKEWKAQAYLLDKVLPENNINESKVDLKQLIVINTK